MIKCDIMHVGYYNNWDQVGSPRNYGFDPYNKHYSFILILLNNDVNLIMTLLYFHNSNIITSATMAMINEKHYKLDNNSLFYLHFLRFACLIMSDFMIIIHVLSLLVATRVLNNHNRST